MKFYKFNIAYFCLFINSLNVQKNSSSIKYEKYDTIFLQFLKIKE